MPTRTIFLTSGTTWSVPADCSAAAAATVECIGAGVTGGNGNVGGGGGLGGGGGAYASASVSLTPRSTVYVQIGNSTGNRDTWLNKTTNAAPASTADGVLAKGGSGTNGGSSASCIGTVKNTGGSGVAITGDGGGGGGSSATAARAGSNGGSGAASSSGGGGGGGGGTGGGGAGTGANSAAGGAGGLAYDGSAGGAADSPGGTKGGGGGGGSAAAAGNPGGAGGTGSEIMDYTGLAAGGGGGGGGGSWGSATTGGGGGAGGLYGGGGGGGGAATSTAGGNGGAGAQGLIVITYTLADDLFVPFFDQFQTTPMLAPPSLNLNFATGTYTSSGTTYALTALPGYSYTRTGTVSYYNGGTSGDVIDDFAANVPPIISGIGYEAYGAVTNYCLQSQAPATAPWAVNAGAAATNNTSVAPDGTSTAATVTVAAVVNSNVYQALTIPNGTMTASVWARVTSGTGKTYLSALDNGTLWGGAVVTTCNLTTTWQRFTVIQTISTGGGGYINIGNHNQGAGSTDASASIEVWQAQAVIGSYADGGPIIATAAATASIGDQTLSVSLANGSYSAVYTFSDGTTQTIPTTISAGAFTMPAYPATLNKPAVSLVTVN